MRTKADDEALSAKATKMAATWRDLMASAESALSARARGDLAHLAIQHEEIVAGLAIVAPLAPADCPRPMTTNAEDLSIALAEEIAADKRWRGKGAQALRLVLPILRRLRMLS